jgi:cytochrome b
MKMKRLVRLTALPVAYAFLYLPFPDTAGACIEEGIGSAVLKVLAAVLVGGVFMYNHFRNRINIFVNKLLSREEKREGAEDQG